MQDHDWFSRFTKRPDALERRLGLTLGVAVVDEERFAAGALAGFDVAPPVPDHVRAREIDLMALRGIEQAARTWLAAGAGLGIVVIADEEFVDRELTREFLVDLLDLGAFGRSARDVRLVRDDDQHVAGIAEAQQRVAGVGQHLDLRRRLRRKRLPVANDGAVDHAIAIKKYGSLQATRTPTWSVSASGSDARRGGARSPPGMHPILK